MAMPRDGGSGSDPEPAEDDTSEAPGVRDTVLVTDGESATGEQVALQLILARAKVRMLANDVGAARAGFGPYVDAVSADVGGGGGLARALRGVRVVVALGRLGKLLPAAKEAGVEHVLLLSTAGMPQPGGLAALFGGGGGRGDAELRDAAREAQLAASGLPHIVVKAGPIRDEPGGGSALAFSSGGGSSGGSGSSGGGVAREDVARVLAALACDVELPRGAAATVVVAADGPGAPPEDWAGALGPLLG